jgi:hypothetical protein
MPAGSRCSETAASFLRFFEDATDGHAGQVLEKGQIPAVRFRGRQSIPAVRFLGRQSILSF